MVLDHLSAISLASSIVQFVDFITRLGSKGHEIYLSVEGASVENHDSSEMAKWTSGVENLMD